MLVFGSYLITVETVIMSSDQCKHLNIRLLTLYLLLNLAHLLLISQELKFKEIRSILWLLNLV